MEIDVSKYHAQEQYSKLSRYPEYREATISAHYTSLAQTANTLSYLINYRKYAGSSAASNEIISILTKQIQDSHYATFGIKLEWNKVNQGDSNNTSSQ